MTRRFLALAAISLLAACGVDGKPTPPTTATPSVSISGDVQFGVSG